MIYLIEHKREELIKLCEKFEISTMYLFGSATKESFDSMKSDIDLLITFKNIPFDRYADNYFELHKSLEKLFKIKVDLVTERSLQNPYFIKDVEKTKRLLYAA